MGRDNSRELRRRSEGILPHRLQPVPWQNDLPFRILSLDGGGIKGIFPAAVLSFLEQEYLQGGSIGGYFDLIAGTSTGGILALGMGAGLTASERNLVSLRAPLFFLRPAGHAHSSENGGYLSCKDGAWNMRELHETIGSLYRATLVGDIEWQVENGSYFAWVGDRCYRLRQQSFLGLSTKETLWVNTAGTGSWRLMGCWCRWDCGGPGNTLRSQGKLQRCSR